MDRNGRWRDLDVGVTICDSGGMEVEHAVGLGRGPIARKGGGAGCLEGGARRRYHQERVG